MGVNIVHLIDCMDFMKDKPDNCYDLAIVDPPYFDGPQAKVYYGGLVSSTGVKRLQKNSKHWQKVDIDYFNQLTRISNTYVFWGCNYYPELQFHTGRFIWDKVNITSPFSDCEIAATNIFDHARLYRYMWNGMLQGKSLLQGNVPLGNKAKNEKRIHPTQKPVVLYKWLLQNYAKPGQTIFDSHVGSGSIRIACHDMGFDFEGCEIDADYYKAQEKRYQIHAAQGDLFNSDEMQRLIF